MYLKDVTGNFVIDLCRIINASSLDEDSILNCLLRKPGADTKYVKATQYFNQLNNIIGKETSVECTIGNIEICGSNKDVKCRAKAIFDSTVEDVIGNWVYDNVEYRGKTISDILADVGG